MINIFNTCVACFYTKKWRKTLAYTKPQVIAQNASAGSYAAGCPANYNGWDSDCRNCERTA